MVRKVKKCLWEGCEIIFLVCERAIPGRGLHRREAPRVHAGGSAAGAEPGDVDVVVGGAARVGDVDLAAQAAHGEAEVVVAAQALQVAVAVGVLMRGAIRKTSCSFFFWVGEASFDPSVGRRHYLR